MNDLATDPAYVGILKDFENQLRSILDPEAVSRQAKKDEGLITAEGKDLTQLN